MTKSRQHLPRLIGSTPPMSLHGKRAVVTGASTGIGRAVALAFAREGANVVVNYRASKAAAEECAETIRQQGGTAYAVQADVGKPLEVTRLFAEAARLLGGLDILANMAGADILTGAAATATDLEKLAALIDTDLRGTMLCAWAATPLLRAGRGGNIINTSWDLALTGMAGRNPEMFAAIKAGVTGFTRALARSLAPEVRVNEVAPGWIETAFAVSGMTAEYREAVIAGTPLARLGHPHEVAAAAVYLASDAASFVTGQTLKVNGGLSS